MKLVSFLEELEWFYIIYYKTNYKWYNLTTDKYWSGRGFVFVFRVPVAIEQSCWRFILWRFLLLAFQHLLNFFNSFRGFFLGLWILRIRERIQWTHVKRVVVVDRCWEAVLLSVIEGVDQRTWRYARLWWGRIVWRCEHSLDLTLFTKLDRAIVAWNELLML